MLLLKGRQQKLNEQLEKTLSEHQKENLELKRRYEDEQRQLITQKQQQSADFNDTMSRLHSDLSVRETELKLVEKSCTDFALLDSTTELWVRLLEVAGE